MVTGIIGWIQQKHEKVILFTKEINRVTQKARFKATGKRENREEQAREIVGENQQVL